MPPVLVRIPTAECMPSISSGFVSLRTSSTASPASVRSTASAAVNASLPTAAPGEAGRPSVSSRPSFLAACLAAGVKLGSSSCVKSSAGMRRTAVFSSISFSLHMSQAIFTAAAPVRLPLRVCSMKSVPFSIVNSMSCTSR